jgi:hypothetical protein
VPVINLTERREITMYQWMHSDRVWRSVFSGVQGSWDAG